MRREEQIARHASVSEKSIERYLVRRVREIGGRALKYSNPGECGYPDRVLVMPGGLTAWVEVKGTGGRATPLQRVRQTELRGLGHIAETVDTREGVDRLLARLASMGKGGVR